MTMDDNSQDPEQEKDVDSTTVPAPQDDSDNVSVLKQIQQGIKREFQLTNWLEELDDKIEKLQRQQKFAQEEMARIQTLFQEHKDVVEVARQFVSLGETIKGKGDEEVRVYNPKYVSRKNKKELLFKILKDHHLETGDTGGMEFSTIKRVLKNRYNIETRSAGDFFRFEMKEYECDGGKRNRRVLFPSSIFESVSREKGWIADAELDVQ